MKKETPKFNPVPLFSRPPFLRAGAEVGAKKKRGFFQEEVFFLLTCPLMGDPFVLFSVDFLKQMWLL